MEMIQKIVTAENLIFMLKAAGLSVVIATASLLFGTILGVLGAAAKISKSKLLRGIATVYVEVIRGTPMMLQILFFYLGVPAIMRAITGTPINPSVYLIGIVAISINSGAYSTELIRSAIQAVDRGQWEASKSLGLSYGKMMRYIILPQAFKRIVPPLVSEFITLIKDSSLLSTIGVVELLQSAKVLGARFYNYVIPLLLASVVYLAMTLTISHFSKRLERRLAESD
ncbi:amino acid ABC transporter permease [Neobittarella massiliensis]|uniref:Amino acid ABC transporter permease n=2 Tax=Oscillospiraceae TaxID=216572 RepID=A0A8J6IP75_9FIRM|nr:amino acid ABC transporter permease [Neobittarella massiliensis]MBC3517299.1 amino acid ABC transporter permease [Neobittarella massiliensis]SCJ75437.1 Arginine transport system permease protein ArtQ [uncultured Anaerotruncus sp.]